jgi:vesicle coat complex subunit
MSNLYLFLSINYHNVDLFLVDSSNKYNHGKIYEMNKAFDYGEISEIMHDRSFINFLKEQGRYLKQRFGNKKIQLVLYINHVFIDIEKKIFDKNFFDPISIKEQILSENLHTKNNDLFYFCHKNKYYRYILRNNNFYLLLNDIKKHLQCDKGLIIDNNVLLNI